MQKVLIISYFFPPCNLTASQREHSWAKYLIRFGHGTPWIADYKDAWTTSTFVNTVNNPIKKLLNFYDKYFEKKWVYSASFVTASSDPIGERVSKLVNVSQKAIYNGYDPEDFESINSTTQHFQISYIGTLYDGQNIEIIIDAFKKFIEQLNPNCTLLFPGIEIDKIQHQRITELLHGYEKYYTTTGRIERKEILNIEKESHILLHIACSGYEGIVASKIYEYIGANRKILVVPGDNSTIDKIVTESKAGVILNNIQDTFEFLCNEYEQLLANIHFLPYQSEGSSHQFTGEYQTKELSMLLKKITS